MCTMIQQSVNEVSPHQNSVMTALLPDSLPSSIIHCCNQNFEQFLTSSVVRNLHLGKEGVFVAMRGYYARGLREASRGVADASYTDPGGTVYRTALGSRGVLFAARENTRCVVPRQARQVSLPKWLRSVDIVINRNDDKGFPFGKDYPSDNRHFIHRHSRKSASQRCLC